MNMIHQHCLTVVQSILLVAIGSAGVVAQEVDLSLKESDWPAIARLKRVENVDDLPKIARLRIELLHAANDELRSRYTYWLQMTGDIEALFRSIDRYLEAQIELDPMADVKELLGQKLELASKIEKQAQLISERKGSAQAFNANYAAKAYRLKTELEFEKQK